MDWDKLRVFHAVAEAGSFTHAGETLNLSQSAVSRQVSALEQSLGTPLFHRHARGLILTEQGETLFDTAHNVFAQLARVQTQLAENKERPQGALKISSTVAFGSVFLASRMKEFVNRFPEIEVSLVLADTELDLSMRQADVAIRLTPPTQPDLVQRHLMTLHYKVYAAPEYLQQNGMPKNARDLDKHRIVVYGEDARPPAANLNWLLTEHARDGIPRKPVLRVNSIYGILRAVQSGLGLGALPEYMGRELGSLVEVLPELQGPELNMYFVYPEELRDSARIVAFRDFIVEKLAPIKR
ncbi:MAG: LysR family transcriptional regulator [Rhodospirillales bacterium]|nr:LysR family transcriptional regulator [Rhodospirillales bacterium]MBO6788249.1 LysR family transcriptional regulator [Rhodospirillales bacterium]